MPRWHSMDRAMAMFVWALLAMAPSAMVMAAADGAKLDGTPAGARDILNTNSIWRFYAAYRPAMVPAGKDGGPGQVADIVTSAGYTGKNPVQTTQPAGDWSAVEYDDSDWGRGFGVANLEPPHPDPAVLGSVGQALNVWGAKFSIGVIYLRGKFAVTDPAAVKELNLTMAYRGGMVVYLNGKQVALVDMPQGKVTMATPASPYPDEAYVDGSGKIIPDSYHVMTAPAADRKDLEDRMGKRDRAFTIGIPTAGLRQGTNVMALEIHRSDYHPVALKKAFFGLAGAVEAWGWVPCAMLDVHLSTSSPAVTSNTARPVGLQVWNDNPNDRITLKSYGDPNENPQIVLAGARNGSFSGQLGVASTQGLDGLKVTAADLLSAAGSISGDHVQVRFGRLDNGGSGTPPKACWYFDGLMDSPPAEYAVPTTGGVALLKRTANFERWEEAKPVAGGAIIPVWVTVHVPRDAAPGKYQGSVNISVAGQKDVSVPIQLAVANWTIPDPASFRTYIGLYESPTSVALRYKVTPWSEEHWKLLEKSFAMLAQVGNQYVNIEVVEHTQFGNGEGMLYWVRKADGTYDYDFTVVDRYLALVKKYLGVPEYVALQIWHSGGWEMRKADQENTVTVVDPKTGERTHLQVPVFDSDKARDFWKPALAACREHLAKAGMEKSMCMGILSDSTAPSSVFAMFDSIWPGGAPARWTRGLHCQANSTQPYRVDKGGGLVVLHEHCYGIDFPAMDKPLPQIWIQRAWPTAAFLRDCYEDRVSLYKYRELPEYGLYARKKGVGRIGLDFWPDVLSPDKLDSDRGSSWGSIFNRFPQSSCAQRAPVMYHLSWAGPAGALATMRFQALIEGTQASEATIVAAEAQATMADKIGPELAEKCRHFYADRLDFFRLRLLENGTFITTFSTGARDLDARAFAAAAEVSARK